MPTTTALSAGNAVSISLAAGSSLSAYGMGTMQIAPPVPVYLDAALRTLSPNEQRIGPFAAAVTVNLTAVAGGSGVSYYTLAPTDVVLPGANAPSGATLTAAQTAATQALVSGAGKQAAPKNNDPATVRAAVYPMVDGSGSTLAELSGRGPSIAVGGTVTGAWANPGWFTHDAAGNTLKLAGNSYIDGILDMSAECSVLVGLDLWLAAWPSSTEVAWGLHRTDTTTGGVRMPLVSGSAGRISLYFKPAGASESELIGYGMPGGTYIGRRISLLFEMRFLPARGELHTFMFVNGQIQRGNVVAMTAPPTTDAAGGLSFSGYGNPVGQKLGSGGSGARTALAFAMRHSGKDRNIAARLAAHIQANRALPAWLNRI